MIFKARWVKFSTLNSGEFFEFNGEVYITFNIFESKYLDFDNKAGYKAAVKVRNGQLTWIRPSEFVTLVDINVK